ncbi:MAG: Holliday junction branch migration protein RuvA, partial [Clostridia bacterium]|nr:Holliday junction branch migration protein RuvA [Clostridia bacterium]
MYAHIRGTVTQVMQDRVILEACGVGYELYCSAETRKWLVIGKEHKLLTHFHISLSQDVMALYGFETEEERAMFRRLIGVTRVGPKLALSVLSVLTVSDIAGAILT